MQHLSNLTSRPADKVGIYCMKVRKACRGKASAQAHAQMCKHHARAMNLNCVFGVEKVVTADVSLLPL